jgi:hypothetical protein
MATGDAADGDDHFTRTADGGAVENDLVVFDVRSRRAKARTTNTQDLDAAVRIEAFEEAGIDGGGDEGGTAWDLNAEVVAEHRLRSLVNLEADVEGMLDA